jgi:diaminopropionate ammonia-lyase family
VGYVSVNIFSFTNIVMAQSRKPILFNDNTGAIETTTDLSIIRRFHLQLPGYSLTPLVRLEAVAAKLGVRSVFVKDESARFGLPAFKILGASWGSCRAIIEKTGIPIESSLEKIAQAAQDKGVILFTASAGNHGRALASMARILSIQARVFVPQTVSDEAIRLITSEGARVTVSKRNYDGAVLEAQKESSTTTGGLFVQDTAFAEYEDIPAWIVEGYSTMLVEIYEQLEEEGLKPDLVVTPVGVGSLAHAVVRYCKSESRDCAVMSVEPNSAACLYQSMAARSLTPVRTSNTIMEGMNCGTLSSTVFKDLQKGIDACASVSDLESHKAVQYLATIPVNSGPCGGAALAALWQLADTSSRPNWLCEGSVVVILSTEGLRQYCCS